MVASKNEASKKTLGRKKRLNKLAIKEEAHHRRRDAQGGSETTSVAQQNHQVKGKIKLFRGKSKRLKKKGYRQSSRLFGVQLGKGTPKKRHRERTEGVVARG